MKLLLDANLSPVLVNRLIDLFPASAHVGDLALESASDEAIWNYAQANSFTIASKDSDFHQRSFLYGAPPKVIWIRLGNCSTRDVEELLRTRHTDLLAFENDAEAAFLQVSRSEGQQFT